MADLGTLTELLPIDGSSFKDVAAVDVIADGIYHISGITKLNQIPTATRLVILDEYNNVMVIYNTGNDGLFDIQLRDIKPANITIISFDISNTFNATIQVDISPVN